MRKLKLAAIGVLAVGLLGAYEATKWRQIVAVDLEMVSSRAGGYPAGKGVVNHPNPKQGAEERLRGEAKEAESGR